MISHTAALACTRPSKIGQCLRIQASVPELGWQSSAKRRTFICQVYHACPEIRFQTCRHCLYCCTMIHFIATSDLMEVDTRQLTCKLCKFQDSVHQHSKITKSNSKQQGQQERRVSKPYTRKQLTRNCPGFLDEFLASVHPPVDLYES